MIKDNIYMSVEDNYKRIVENVQAAELKAGRGDKVRIMAVTKMVDVERIKTAIACGISLLGENRVQEYLSKCGEYPKSCEIHFIGGLQSNKIKPLFRQHDRISMIQSVGSEKLAREIDAQTRLLHSDANIVTDILIQVNIGNEETKGGVFPDELYGLVEAVDRLDYVRLRGLMTIPPKGESIKYFAKMQRLFEDLKSNVSTADTLSMGMSEDYAVAVEYGSNIVRVGTALFGQRF
ncbi:MAG: YggS family pyridoxal phosphate-dependent enzyme [Oscillospiraceae bacterium]|nr:YggS family pyridoxal phosphate-dependent enzyme [Oscillospiraceae bacterium]